MRPAADGFGIGSAWGACVAFTALAACSATKAPPRAPADEAGIRWYQGSHATEKIAAGRRDVIEDTPDLTSPTDDEDLPAPKPAASSGLDGALDPLDASLGSVPDFDAFVGVGAGPRTRIGPRKIGALPRARVGKSTAIDLGSLPLAEESAPGEQAPGARFQIVKRDVVPKCPASFMPRERTEFHLAKSWTMPAVVRLGGEEIPAVELDGAYEDPSGLLGRVFLRSPRHAEWTLMDERRRSARDVDVLTFEGKFDAEHRAATATRKFSATAHAIVPALVYAFRRCETRCDRPLGDPDRVDVVSLLGPPASWTGSTGDTDEQHLLSGQPFTEVSAEIRPGSSASLAISVAPDAARAFGFALVKTPIADTTTYSLEVVWPAGEDPELTLFEEKFPGAAASTGFSYPSSPEEDCLPQYDRAYEFAIP